MDFGSNALENKVYPIFPNQPEFNNVLTNKKSSTFGETWEGLYGMRWDYLDQQFDRFHPNPSPSMSFLYERPKITVDPNFRTQLIEDIKNGNIPDNELQYLSQTKWAANQEDYLQIIENQKILSDHRDQVNNSEWYKVLGASVFLPENLITLPIGGPGKTLVTHTLKGFSTAFASMLVLETGLEALRYPYDARSNIKESAVNVATTATGAGLLTGGFRFGTRFYSNKVLNNTVNNLNEMNKVLFNDPKPSLEKIAVQKAFNKKTIIKKGTKFVEQQRQEQSSKIWGTDKKLKKWVLTFAPTPYKNWNNNFKGTKTYDYMSMLMADQSLLTIGNMRGEPSFNSVYSLSKVKTGETVWPLYRNLTDLWALETGRMPGSYTVAGINAGSIRAGMKHKWQKTKWSKGDQTVGSVDDWLEMVNYKAIKNPKSLKGPYEKRAAKLIDEYFKEWEPLLRERGLIGSGKFYKAEIKRLQDSINDLEIKFNRTIKQYKAGKLKDIKMTENQYIDFVTRDRERLKIELDNNQRFYAESKTQALKGAKNDPHYFARFWSTSKIKANRQSFEDILTKWFKNQDAVDEKGIPFNRTENEARIIAKDSIALILSEADDGVNIENLHIAGNVSKHQKGRQLTIPNHMVVDFIETNPMTVIRSYDQRMNPRYNFDVIFDGKNIDEVMSEIFADAIENGMTVKQAQKQLRNFRHSYDVVLRQNMRNPARWDTKTWKAVQDLAGMYYLPRAALGTISEPAVIGMNHGWRSMNKSFFGMLNLYNPEISKIKQRMPEWYGEGLELVQFMSQHRFDGNSNYASPTKNWWENTVNSFYVLNGLTHATKFLKDWESLTRAHSIIDYSKKWVKGEASEFERLFLLRGGIDENTAKFIAAAPTQNTKKDGSGLWLANIDDWKGKVDPQVITNFQVSMSNGILNTIIMSTPADRPIIMDNVMYVRKEIGWIVGLKEDPKFPGYARVENAILSKPLQFYSYLLAATTKITGAVTQGMISNKQGDFVFMAIMFMGLGYLQYQIRTPDWKEEQHTFADKISRSLDYSGMLSLYSDIFYQGLHFAGEMGAEPTLFDEINPKFDTTDPAFGKASAIIGLFGAVPSMFEEMADMTREVYHGNYEHGVAWLSRLPFANLWAGEKITNQIGKVIR